MTRSLSKPDETTRKRLVSANTVFGFRLFAEVARRDFGQNIFVSPFSIASVLATACNGAGGATQKAIAETLQLQGMSIEKVNHAHAELRGELEKADLEDNGLGTIVESFWRDSAEEMEPPAFLQLVIANSLWARRGIAFKPDFVRRVQSFYRAKVSDLDFTDPAAATAINKWVAEQTNQKIPGIVSGIHPDAVLLLMNAVYFRGIWRAQFDESRTTEGVFTLLDGSQKKHPMMSLPKPRLLPYYRAEGFQAVGLPYGKGRTSMYIFLPDKEVALVDFLDNLTAENWRKWMAEFAEVDGNVVLPRFKFDYTVILNEALEALGMGIAFDREKADFGNISTASPIWIDEVRHKTFVEVNERGTEAAAATAEIVWFFIPNQAFEMVVDRPFFCAIRDNKTGTLLFMGVIVEPK